MEIKDTYQILKGDSEGLYKEKGSKFLSFAYVVQSEEEIKERITDLKKKYYDARHHCFAYVLGFDGEIYRANDDGEPGHTAGDPILGQIRSHELTNTLIVVVRYFGGTKLGVGGLIQAYKTAAADAIRQNEVMEKQILSEIKVRFEYPQLNNVMKLVKDHELEITSQSMELTCEMTLAVRLSKEEMLRAALVDFHEISVV